VGLQTGNNGKYVGLLSTTKEGEKIKTNRLNKLFDFITGKHITDF